MKMRNAGRSNDLCGCGCRRLPATRLVLSSVLVGLFSLSVSLKNCLGLSGPVGTLSDLTGFQKRLILLTLSELSDLSGLFLS